MSTPKINLDTLPDSLCGFKIKSLLGSGNYSSVYLGQGDVAIKKSDLSKEFEDIVPELDILSRVNHPNVVLANKIDFDAETACLVMPAGYINLKNYIDKSMHLLTNNMKEDIILSIMGGLNYLHQNFILHLDLHAENIVLYKEGDGFVPKIIDFGLARNFNETITKLHFNLSLSPPEVILNKMEGKNVEVGPEFDNWYLANVIYYIYYGFYPFYNQKLSSLDMLLVIKNLFGLTPEQQERVNKKINANNDYLLDWAESYKIPKLDQFNLFIADPIIRADLTLFLPNENTDYIKYPDFKINIQLINRENVLEWLYMVTKHLSFPEKVFYEAVELLERIAEFTEISSANLNFWALVCLDLASLFMYTQIKLKDYMDLLNDGTTKEDFKIAEREIIKKLKGGYFKPTLDMLYPEFTKLDVLDSYFNQKIPSIILSELESQYSQNISNDDFRLELSERPSSSMSGSSDDFRLELSDKTSSGYSSLSESESSNTQKKINDLWLRLSGSPSSSLSSDYF